MLPMLPCGIRYKHMIYSIMIDTQFCISAVMCHQAGLLTASRMTRPANSADAHLPCDEWFFSCCR